MSARHFDYGEAFSRNLGWFSEAEQAKLRDGRVAIAGLGGVGGIHLLTLARLGIGHFRIADFDRFDVANFNRQVGATMTTLDRPKIDVLAEQVLDINPEIELDRFPQGVATGNMDAFLDGADVYVDGLDFFAFAARRATFAACHKKGIPAVTAAPLGMGTGLLVFVPGGMSFEDYFQLEGCDETEMALRFLVGLAPAGLHRPYLVEPSRIDLARRKGPSTMIACNLCAGVAAAETIKLLLGRGEVRPAPWGLQFDAYRQKTVRTWRPGGNGNPLQRLILAIGRRQLLRQMRQQQNGDARP
ncbi:ThiF family adenylyltransferase [Methyloversatilis sp.]|uniref:ThiF family adenylyltransferase n=1 Tax=Methyloversatilis sp. TaxID=2569862 RepID=UPI0035B2BECE